MAQSAIVVAVSGQAVVVNAVSGQSRVIAAGDRLAAGEIVRTLGGARVELALDDGQSLILGEGREFVLGDPGAAIAAPATEGVPAEILAVPPSSGEAPAGAQAQRVIEALQRGQALDADLEAPAAGLGAGGGGQGNAGFVRLMRINESVTPLEYAYTAELLPRVQGLEGGVPSQAPGEPAPLTNTLSLSATPHVSEGGTVTYVATLGQPALTTLTVHLGAELPDIVIAAGASSGSVTVPVQTDDPYVDGETISATIESVQGGGFDALYVSDAPAVTVVADTIDPTTLTLSSSTNGVPVTEGGSIIYTVATNNEVKGSPLEVTLSNGLTLTIPVGGSEASVTVPVRADEAYSQGEQTLDTVTIASAVQTPDTAGNFEGISPVGAVNNTVVDDGDVTKVTLSTADVPETADRATFTIVLSSAPQGGAGGTANVTITHADGSTESRNVAIGADGRGSFEVLFSDNDVYKDADSISATVNAVSGNFELVDYSKASAVAAIYDVDDTSTVTLSGPDTVAQGGVITYTATVNEPVTVSPLVVTLNNDQTITIPVGQTSASIAVDLSSDVLATQTVQIANVTGGNYEVLAWTGTVVTDIDSLPSTASGSLDLVEGVDALGQAVLTFVTGADAMDPARYAFADPATNAPTVSGLLSGESLNWTRSADGQTLTAITSGGDTITLTLSGQSASGVRVDAVMDGNLLHSGSIVNIGNVVVNAADTDGDATTGTVSLSVAEGPTPTTTFTSVVGSTTAPGDIYTGLWQADLGVDDTVPTVSDVLITGAKLDGVSASWSFDYDEAAGVGSGVITGAGGLTMPFTFTLDDAGSYKVDLAELSKQVTITADDYASTSNPSGPTDAYVINYYDTNTGASSSATVTSLGRTAPGTSLNLVGKTADGTATYTATAVGTNVNASGSGIGFDNNLMSSYVDYDHKTKTTTLTTESLLFNPDGQASSIVVDFTGNGANAFGGNQHDVLYLTLTSDTGATQTIMLDSRFGDFVVNGTELTPITGTSYSGGALANYTLTLPAGWNYIAEVQATPGFYDAGGDIETSQLKMAFGFTTSTTLNVDVPTQIDFSATVTDADHDLASSNFTLQTYVGATGSGTDGSDVITGTSGADTVLAGAGNDLLMASAGADALSGGAGIDTVSYALASASVNADLGAGTASTMEGSTLVTDTLSGIENVIGSPYADTLAGDSGANVLQGGAGADNLYGGAGLDTASYASASAGITADLGGGTASTQESGAMVTDTLHDIESLAGSSFADSLTGDSGSNAISGGAGDDLITGGFGDDTLAGGTGSDTFDYNAGESGNDVIRDFNLAHVDHGGDRLDLTDLLTSESYTAESLSGYLSFSQNAAGHAQIIIDANGDGIPDNLQVITLENLSLADLQAYAGGDSDVAIIQKLLDNGNLRKEA